MKRTLNLQTNLAFATLGPKAIHEVSMNKGTGYSIVQNDTVTLHVQRQKREKGTLGALRLEQSHQWPISAGS